MRLPPSSILAARLARVRQAFDAVGLDAIVVTNPVNIRYLTNHVGSAGIAVLTGSVVHLVIDFRYEEAVRALQASEAACPALQTWPVPASYEEALLSCLGEIGVTTVGFEAEHVTVARHAWWRDSFASR